MFVSNSPWSCTGYGNQTRMFVPRLKALGHEMAIHAFYGLQGGILNWDGVPVYPVGYHPYGQDIMAAHAGHFGADIAITLIDAWVMEPRMHGPRLRWVPWYPVDQDPIPPPVAEKVRQAYQPIVYSKYGEAKSRDAGIDCRYVPHGVETKTFHPMDRQEARESVPLPDDRFVVGMVAANKGIPSRKSFPQCFEAFAQFHKAHADAMLYVHTVVGTENGGINLIELAEYFGLKGSVFFCDQYRNMIGLPEPHMAALYNSFDVLLSPSMGEGFGIPILEAQACGTPVITGEWTSMPELTFSGWMVPRSEAEPCWSGIGSFYFTPRIEAIRILLEEAYARSGDPSVKEAARRGALEYDADRVTEKHWLPVLEEIEGRIKAGAGELKLVRF